ncbi:MAG: hypothetical protein JXR45_23240, partial [Deltaproteobacteria bacterium]|nr:hypothetical protein [Deltaproteobacteria bacterium]
PVKSANAKSFSSRLVGVSDVLSTADGVTFAVMPFPGGVCLDRILFKKKKFPASTAVKIALNLSLIVRTIHIHGKGHGHINPKTVFIKRSSRNDVEVHLLFHELEGSSSMVNEIAFLSPEQASECKGVQPSDDIWAISSLLYHMLLGEPPFVGKSREETIGRILTEELVLHESLEKNFLPIASFLYRGLAKSPREWFKDSREMVRRLKSIRDQLRDGTGACTITQSFIAAMRTEISSTVPTSSDPIPPARLRKKSHESGNPPDDPYTRETLETVDAPQSLYITSENKAVRSEPSRRSTLPSPPLESAIVISLVDDLDTTLPSFSTAIIARKEKKFKKKTSRTVIIIPAIVAAALLTTIAIFGYRAQTSSSDTEKRSSAGARVLLPEPNSATDSADAVNRTDELTGEDQQPSVRDATIETVTITLENLPSGASLTLNGKPAASPITIQKSDEPIALHAFLGNRLIFTTTVSPTEDKRIAVTIDETSISKADSAKKHRRKKSNISSQSTDRKSGQLSSNPYNLRKNPFATGE